jgi:hypothetical protein
MPRFFRGLAAALFWAIVSGVIINIANEKCGGWHADQIAISGPYLATVAMVFWLFAKK